MYVRTPLEKKVMCFEGQKQNENTLAQYLGCLDSTRFEFFNGLQSALGHGRSHGLCTETNGKQ